MTASNLPVMFKNENERLEECLRILVAKTYSQSRGLQGNKRVSFCNQTKSIQVNLDELVNVSGLQKRLQKCEEDKKELEEQVQDLEKRCEVLLQEIVYEQTKVKNLEVEVKNLEVDVKNLEGVIERQCKQNRELSAYLDHLEDNSVCINCIKSFEK